VTCGSPYFVSESTEIFTKDAVLTQDRVYFVTCLRFAPDHLVLWRSASGYGFRVRKSAGAVLVGALSLGCGRSVVAADDEGV
jgi:hypothetical protein